MGTGVDQHGQEVTTAATRAVQDAISGVCLIGLLEMVELDDINDMLLDVLVSCPRPQEVDTSKVLQALPFGKKEIQVVEGGMVVKGHSSPALGDRSDEIIVANAAVTVSVDTDKVKIRQ